MLPKLNKTLEESVRCPECREIFTYREREAGLEGEGLPVALICGHKLCFGCLRANVIFSTANDDFRQEILSFNCAVCGQKQARPCGRRDQDLVKTFPLDISTIGLLASLEHFGPSFLPHLVTPVHSEPMALQPAITLAFAEQASDREMKSLEKMNSCNICSSEVVDWRCMSCDICFCFLCVSYHEQTCSAKSVDLVPFDVNGNLMKRFPEIRKSDHNCTWECIIHEGHQRRIQCRESQQKHVTGSCVEKDKIEGGRTVAQEVKMLLRFVKELITATEKSICDLSNVGQLIVSIHENDRASIVAFFERLQSSAMFSINLLLQKQIEIDGKRLFFLNSLTDSFNRQMSELKFLRIRWNFLLSDFIFLGIDLRREQAAFEEELLSFSIWDPNVLLSKRVKMERFLDAVWEKGIPKGLRSSISKSQMEFSFSDSEIGQFLDAFSVSSCLVESTEIPEKFEFNRNLPVPLTTPIDPKRQSGLGDQMRNFRECFRFDGLVPRNWFPQFANLIDSSPTLCVVTHVENPPSVFWIRSNHRAGDFANLVNFMQKFCEDSPFATEEISAGEIYAVEIQSHKDNAWSCGQVFMNRKLWMRVQILPETADIRDSLKCRLMDLGHVMTFKKNELKTIPVHVQQIEPFARRAKLSGFVPYFGGVLGNWSPMARDHFYSWLKIAGVPFIILEDIVDDDQLVVDMWSPAGVQSLKEFLMFCGCGTLDTFSAAFENMREGGKTTT